MNNKSFYKAKGQRFKCYPSNVVMTENKPNSAKNTRFFFLLGVLCVGIYSDYAREEFNI